MLSDLESILLEPNVRILKALAHKVIISSDAMSISCIVIAEFAV